MTQENRMAMNMSTANTAVMTMYVSWLHWEAGMAVVTGGQVIVGGVEGGSVVDSVEGESVVGVGCEVVTMVGVVVEVFPFGSPACKREE